MSLQRRLFNLAFVVTGAVVLTGSIAQASLIGYYTFEGSAADVSGNGKNGTFGPTAPTLTPNGFSGSAYQFGADASTYITVPININPGALPQVTFGAWVNAATANNVIRGIISHDTGNFDRTLDMDTRGPAAGPEWCAFAGPVSLAICNGAVSANEWVFLAVRYDANTGAIALTRNGSHTLSNGFPENNGTTVTYIGRNPGFDSPFDGRIDNVFFYDEFLSDAQVESIYRNGVSNVPEPSSFVLMAAALGCGLVSRVRRRG
ncbi:MAG TPA: LamG domain-containing protein [Bryobacteraceae bacterium]|nr:LamG domain-containing protein [Bryobacteraceae bacterium]